MPAAPIHHTAIDAKGAWDGAAAEKAFDKIPANFPLFYCWIDKGEVDPNADGTDKEDGWGPHHDVNGQGVPGAANLAALHAAVGRLNSSGITVPSGDRQATFNHLIAHLKDAGVETADLPELKSADQHKGRVRRELDSDSRETRYYTVKNLEVRDASQTASGMVEVNGTVIVYGVPYEVCDAFGSFSETIHFGAATQVLQDPGLDVRFLFNHGDMPMARTASPSCPLTLTEDQQGVHIQAQLDPQMNNAHDLLLAMDPQHQLVTQMSVGMQVDPEGDLWSGSDDYGLPNVRNIVKLANIFDTSAVTYPASPTTTIATARSKFAYEAARQVRAGRGTQQQGELVMRLLEEFGEHRDEPTAQDGKVADQITKVGHAIADLKAAQAADPDTNTDPQDAKVVKAIGALSDAHDAVVAAQAKDGNPDAPEPPETDSADPDDSEAEQVQPDPDGTMTDGAGNAPVPDNFDGTGSRAAELQEELRARKAALDVTRRRLALERARLTAGRRGN